ncbi:MAG TPA: phenylalanine--tRNA ligase subunit beta [Candidatus Nanoarchaeia archaeon]|nr:phenylalanine--tRNA ligase subunit beta [Candidatus Nanoarchaeia archaeon]
MPTVRFNKDVFERYAGKKLPLDELKERISFLGTDLEGIEDNIITVEVFPNRPDMLSVQGFARAFSSFIGKNTGLLEYEVHPSKEKVIIEKSVHDVRPYTACAIVRGLHFDDEKIKEVIDIQEKLHITYGRNRKKIAIGIYPFEKIKMPITFTARKPEDIVFRPLGAEKEMDAKEILELHPTGKQYGHLLLGKKHYPVFLDATGKVLSLPPIINSHETGRITEKTQEVFIECSGFDYGLLSTCLNMILAALSDMGGKIESLELEYSGKTLVSPDLSPKELDVEIHYLNKRLGLTLSEKEFSQLLSRMGFGYKHKKVLVPAYRADILHQIDIAEDIAIAHGYEHFEEIIPKVATVARESPREIFKNKVADLLVGLGYQEASTYNLSNEEHQSSLMNTRVSPIRLTNAVSLEYNVLRSWLLPALFELSRHNTHYEYPQKIFTMGMAFSKDSHEETGVREDLKLAILSSHDKADYTEGRQIVEYILRSIDVFGKKIEEADHPSFIPGRCARILIGSKEIGIIGEVSPRVLRNWGLSMPAVALEIHLDTLFTLLGNSY